MVEQHTRLGCLNNAGLTLYSLGLALGLYNVLMDVLTIVHRRLHSHLPEFLLHSLGWLLMPRSVSFRWSSGARWSIKGKAVDAAAILLVILLFDVLVPRVSHAFIARPPRERPI